MTTRAPAALGHGFALALALGLGGCAYDRVADETVIQWYDLEEDIELGEETLARFLQVLDEKKVAYDKDAKLLAEIRDMVRRIAEVSHYPELPWEAHLAEVPEANAWCAPGGKIMVYRGLVHPKTGLVKTRHELAAILAHECAHATARHVTRARSRQFTLMAAGFPVWLALAVFIPGAGDAFGLVFNTSLNLYLPAYSRDQEEEADALGILYMANAGYDPEAAIRIWKRAAERGEGGGGLYSTHPDHAARAAALEALLPEAKEAYEAARARAAAKRGAGASAAGTRPPAPARAEATARPGGASGGAAAADDAARDEPAPAGSLAPAPSPGSAPAPAPPPGPGGGDALDRASAGGRP